APHHRQCRRADAPAARPAHPGRGVSAPGRRSTMNRLQALTRLRSLARKTGLIRVLSRLNRRRSKTYEARFAAALAAAIKPGDRVWDIGANVGYYTERFADAVGPWGQVVAF